MTPTGRLDQAHTRRIELLNLLTDPTKSNEKFGQYKEFWFETHNDYAGEELEDKVKKYFHNSGEVIQIKSSDREDEFPSEIWGKNKDLLILLEQAGKYFANIVAGSEDEVDVEIENQLEKFNELVKNHKYHDEHDLIYTNMVDKVANKKLRALLWVLHTNMLDTQIGNEYQPF